MTFGDILFELDSVSLRAERSGRNRLDGISLQIPGGTTAIVGLSGAGKSSLLNVLAGFEPTSSGSVRINPADRSFDQRLPLYWVPQGGGLWFHLTVRDHLTGVHPSADSEVRENFADKMLSAFDLSHRNGAYPSELSQGERSRLALARAIATDAKTLILDEPLSHVDTVRQAKYWEVLREVVSERAINMVFASHEPEVILGLSRHLICLRDGKVAWTGSTQKLYHHPDHREAAVFLGPVNWFGSANPESDLLPECVAGLSPQYSGGIRPERILARLMTQSPIQGVSFQVVKSRRCGWFSETRAIHLGQQREFSITHLATDVELSEGQCVQFELVADTGSGGEGSGRTGVSAGGVR